MPNDFDSFHFAIRQPNSKVTDEEWSFFQSGFILKSLKPREFFIEAGKRSNILGFVTSGLIRDYYRVQRNYPMNND
jgi:hypothetical protein